MAAAKKQTANSNVSMFRIKPKKKRKGIVAKTKTSRNKNSKNYKKLSRGQG